MKKVARFEWERREQERLVDSIFSEAHADAAGIRRWDSNGAVVPPHVYEDAGLDIPAGHQAAYEVEAHESLTQYRKAMENHVHSPEEIAEMTAAFGPGTEVVNVITGKKTVLPRKKSQS